MRIARVLLLAVLCPGMLYAAAPDWIAAWATAQQASEPRTELPEEDRHDVTLRQIVRLSMGGDRLRLRLSNQFGAAAAHFSAVHVAVASSPAAANIVAGSDRSVLFEGRPDVVIPAGAEYLSDPIDLKLSALTSVAISLYGAEWPAHQTGHPGSRATSYVAHGNQVAAADLASAKSVEHWYFIDRVDVVSTDRPVAAIMLGDSITDGRGSTTNGNDRWPDLLAERLQAANHTRRIAVLNVGLGGNRLLQDGAGPNAMARLGRDVLEEAHGRYLVVFEGINDLGTLTRDAPASPEEHEKLVQHMTGAYAQIVSRAHERGLKVYGATLYPFIGFDYYHPDAANEADRQAVNQWIRAPGHFDAVLDFDRVMRDPQHPDRLAAQFDSGDHLHPSPAGMRALAESVPLNLFKD